MMLLNKQPHARASHAAARALAMLVAPLLLTGCGLSEHTGDEQAEVAGAPAEEARESANAPAEEASPAAAPPPPAAASSEGPNAEAAPAKSAEAPAADAPSAPAAGDAKPAAAPDPLQPRREGVALAITGRSGPAKSAGSEGGAPDAGGAAPTQAEVRRWTLGHVELRGPWKAVVPTGDEPGPASVQEFRTGAQGWVEASARDYAALRIGELTRARVSQWRLGDEEEGRLVIELTRGRVVVRPLSKAPSGKARDVLVKTPGGDVVVRETVEVSYDAAAGVRSRLPAQ